MQLKHESPLDSWQGAKGVTYAFARADNLVSLELRALYTYWLIKSVGRVGPARSEIKPKDIPSLLRNFHLYDVQNDGHAFRVRLSGTYIVEAMGSDPTGRIMAAGDSDPVNERMFASLSLVLEHRLPIKIETVRATAPLRNFAPAESLMLPLSEDGTAIDKILAATIFAAR